MAPGLRHRLRNESASGRIMGQSLIIFLNKKPGWAKRPAWLTTVQRYNNSVSNYGFRIVADS